MAHVAKKPRCRLIGTDGNVFALGGKVREALRKAKQEDKASEFTQRLFRCTSYEEALTLMDEYVTIT